MLVWLPLPRNGSKDHAYVLHLDESTSPVTPRNQPERHNDRKPHKICVLLALIVEACVL